MFVASRYVRSFLFAVTLISSAVQCYHMVSSIRSSRSSAIKESSSSLKCQTGGSTTGSTFNSPASISAMMKDVAKAIIAARDAQVSVALVDVPVPVTGDNSNNNNDDNNK
jgi:hypothetical protein